MFLTTLLVLGGSAARPNTIDLDKIMNEPSTLRWTAISYYKDRRPVLYVFGDMEVIEQQAPKSSAEDIVPTCKGKITPEAFKELLRVMKEQRFLELPEQSYFSRLEDLPDDRKLHSIVIDDGKSRFSRGFASGTHLGQPQLVPPQFAAVEQQLETVRKYAAWQRPCRFAPAVKRRQHVSQVATPGSR